MSRKSENQGFQCEQCGEQVLPVTNGSYRNHCPFCLYSKHVDFMPGDRAESCGGLMVPVGIRYHSKKGYQILHRCQNCGMEQLNKAARDTIQPDDLEALQRLTVLS
jgi:hypothetical protein